MREAAGVHLENGLTEQTIDVAADVDVRVTTHFKPVAVAGMAVLALGMAGIIVGSAMFVAAYPDTWYAVQATEAESLGAIEAVAVTLGGGVTLFFLGMALFFHGRQVIGRGGTTHTDAVVDVEAEESDEEPPAAAAPPALELEDPVTAFDDMPWAAAGGVEEEPFEEEPVEEERVEEARREGETWP